MFLCFLSSCTSLFPRCQACRPPANRWFLKIAAMLRAPGSPTPPHPARFRSKWGCGASCFLTPFFPPRLSHSARTLRQREPLIPTPLPRRLSVRPLRAVPLSPGTQGSERAGGPQRAQPSLGGTGVFPVSYQVKGPMMSGRFRSKQEYCSGNGSRLLSVVLPVKQMEMAGNGSERELKRTRRAGF